VADYAFTPDRTASFLPGQYMEWTLDHPKVDSRGNRRTFSIASSPTEPNIHMGVKFYEPSSTYKKALSSLKPGGVVYAGPIAGDFVLPADKSEKLVLIAGGIGITPFRSMLKYLLDMREQRDIVLVYAVSDPSEVAYEDVLKAAEAKGVHVIRLLTAETTPEGWKGATGRLTGDFIKEHIKDHTERSFYISGPNAMVQGTRDTLRKLNVKKIKTDYFTGY
jgi:ferredoxin-NADP reductase